MSKRKISWNKNSFLKIAKIFLIAIIIVINLFPKQIVAEQVTPKYQYFIVEKKWENDLATERPNSVTINIIDSDNPNVVVATGELNASNGWKYEFTLPAYKNGTTLIQYKAYEVEPNDSSLNKYILSNPESNPLPIEKKLIFDDNSERSVVTSPYRVVKNTELFNQLSMGNIIIDSDLPLDGNGVTRSLPEGFTYTTDVPKYTDPGDSSYRYVVPRVVYTGDLAIGDNPIPGSIVLTYKKKATDFFTKQQYDVQVIISNITISSLVAAEGKRIAVLCYDNNLLNMEAFVTTFGSELKENVVGVSADVEIKVLNAPEKSFTQAYITDLDVGDYLACYGVHNTNPENYMGNYHNLSDGYAEGVNLLSGVASDIYLTSENNTLLISDGVRFVDGTGSTEVNSDNNTLKFIATASSYKFTWTGSKCQTAILALNPDAVPLPTKYTNTITNTSAFYEVRYFFQDNSGNYPTTPDKTEGPLMIKPSTTESQTVVSVAENAKIVPTQVDATKTGYELDESDGRTNKTEKKQVETSHTIDNPQILNVYFRQKCAVIYHDNYNDKLWNPEDQTYDDNLHLNDDTPLYNDGIRSKIPVNPGYDFVGWSEINYDEWKESGKDDGPIFQPYGEVEPEKVSKQITHYLAHWQALPNQYVVHYFYEVNGSYPSIDNPDYKSDIRTDKKTDELATITEEDKIPNSEKPNYYLNSGMTSEWSKTVDGNGNTILRVYFKQRVETIKIPVTGID